MNNAPQRKEPILDHYVRASIDQANGKHDRSGHYVTLILKLDTSDLEHAKEMRNALYRSAHHLGVHLNVELSRRHNGNYQITFTAVHKKYREPYWSGLEIYKRQKRQDKRKSY